MGLFNSIRLGSSAAGDYEVERSLKFNGADGAYLERTPSSSSNQRTMTFSFWFKRAENDGFATVFRSKEDANNRHGIDFVSGGQLRLWGNDGGSVAMTVQTTQVFRDYSAWYHFVLALDTTQATDSNRVKMYINGEQITDFTTATYPSQNFDFGFNYSSADTQIGTDGGTTCNFYLAEFHEIDGLQLTPSSFAETDAVTGEYKPKKYAGSYGTNGFYLNFSDNSNTTAATLGKDSSGNGHNFTPNNFSVAAGVGNDSLTDTPTNNFCTFNPLKVNPSAPIVFKEGNLEHNGVSGNNHLRSATTMQVTSGKWYVEFKFISGYETANGTVGFGICTDAGHRDSNNDAAWYENSNNFLALQYRNDGEIVRSEAATSTDDLTGLSTFANGDVMGLALDLDNDKFFVSKNGTWFSNGTGTQDPANGTNPLYSGGVLTSRKSDGFYFNISGYSAQVVAADFGQHGYAYTPPTGFKKVCTANLSDPSIKIPNKHFDTLLYTGTNTSSLNNVTGLEFQPDWVWGKARNDTIGHILFDAVRGEDKQLETQITDAEVVRSSAAYRFLSNGFAVSTVGNLNNPVNYVAWNWKAGGAASSNSDGSITSSVSANTSAGFSIGTFTGTGSNGSIGHGLGVAPSFIVVKSRSHSDNWFVYHKSLGANAYIMLNSTDDADTSNSTVWQNVSPTSSVFYASTGGYNDSGEDLVFYAFSEVAGYSKFGSYTGNQNADGTFVYLGFTPAWIMIKNADNASNRQWCIIDATRTTINKSASAEVLFANDSQSESVANNNYGQFASKPAVDILSNGFKVREGETTAYTQTNRSNSHIYLAFAESPFKYARAR